MAMNKTLKRSNLPEDAQNSERMSESPQCQDRLIPAKLPWLFTNPVHSVCESVDSVTFHALKRLHTYLQRFQSMLVNTF